MSSRDRDAFFAPFTCAWLMAAAVVATAFGGCALGFAWRDAALLAMLMAVGSPLWHYARFDTNEPLQCAALAGAAYCVFRIRGGAGMTHSFVAGTLLGAAIAAKAQNVLVVPWFALYVAWTAGRSRIAHLSAMALALAGAVGALAAMNASRYGSPFETGYHLTAEMFAIRSSTASSCYCSRSASACSSSVPSSGAAARGSGVRAAVSW